jgi:hypothetical protein
MLSRPVDGAPARKTSCGPTGDDIIERNRMAHTMANTYDRAPGS